MVKLSMSLMISYLSHSRQIQTAIILVPRPPVLLSILEHLRHLWQHHLKHQLLHLHQGYWSPSCPLKLLQFKVQTSRKRKHMGRPHKRIYARRHTVGIPNTREDASTQLQDPIPKMRQSTSQKFSKTHPRRGYTSKFRLPLHSYPKSVEVSQRDTKRIASTPTGMRILDVGILAWRGTAWYILSLLVMKTLRRFST